MKTLTLKNIFLVPSPEAGVEALQEWLAKRALHGKQSRSRTRFLKEILDRAREILDERQTIVVNHAEKKEIKGEDGKVEEKPVMLYLERDEKGNLVLNDNRPVEVETTDPKKGETYKIKDIDATKKEMEELLDEEYLIDITPANKDTIKDIKDILINVTDEFSGAMATRYDEWCEAFEKAFPEKKE